MLLTPIVIRAFLLGLMVLCPGVVFAENFPNRPIRILVAEAGGADDLTARIIARGISMPLGQSVIVENRGSLLAVESFSRATPDGYTLLVSGNFGWIGSLMRKTSYDPVKDFSAVTLSTATPLVVVVHPSVPLNSVKELIAFAKAKPGMLNYGSGPTGGVSHLGPELFKNMAGVNIVRVPYKGSGLALNALISGEVQLMISNANSTMPHVASGRLKALAITSPQPTTLLPGLPTVAATVPGFEFEALSGVLVPTGTSAAIIKRLNQEIVRVLNNPDVKEKFIGAGAEVVASSPAQFAAKIKSEIARIGKLIKDAGIYAE